MYNLKLNIFSLLFSISFIQNTFAQQIPNGGFENWETIENYEKPTLWATNQDTSRVRIEKSTDAMFGDYSLKLVPGAFSAWHQCNSRAWLRFGFDEPLGANKSITFYAKTVLDSLNLDDNTFLNISGSLHSEGDYLGPFELEINEPIEEFSKIQIPILAANVDTIRIFINGGAGNGATDGCYGRSISWLDGFGIEDTYISNVNSEIVAKEIKVDVFPNPTNGLLNIYQKNVDIDKYFLYTLEGKLVKRGNLNQTKIQIGDNKGLFILKLIDEDSDNYFETYRRIVVQ